MNANSTNILMWTHFAWVFFLFVWPANERLLFCGMETAHCLRRGCSECSWLVAKRGRGIFFPQTHMLYVELINETTKLKCIQCWRCVINEAHLLPIFVPSAPQMCLALSSVIPGVIQLGAVGRELIVTFSRLIPFSPSPSHPEMHVNRFYTFVQKGGVQMKGSEQEKNVKNTPGVVVWGYLRLERRLLSVTVWMYKLNLITFEEFMNHA